MKNETNEKSVNCEMKTTWKRVVDVFVLYDVSMCVCGVRECVFECVRARLLLYGCASGYVFVFYEMPTPLKKEIVALRDHLRHTK